MNCKSGRKERASRGKKCHRSICRCVVERIRFERKNYFLSATFTKLPHKKSLGLFYVAGVVGRVNSVKCRSYLEICDSIFLHGRKKVAHICSRCGRAFHVESVRRGGDKKGVTNFHGLMRAERRRRRQSSDFHKEILLM